MSQFPVVIRIIKRKELHFHNGLVDVDDNDPDMPPNVELTTGSVPSTVIVPDGGTATDTNGYYAT